MTEGLLVEKGNTNCEHSFVESELRWSRIGEDYREYFEVKFRLCIFCGRRELISGILSTKKDKKTKVEKTSPQRIEKLISRNNLKTNRDEIFKIYERFGFFPANKYYSKMLPENIT